MPTINEIEINVLNLWDNQEVFKKSVENRSEDKQFAFYDGPPFATGLPHYGHILASTIKDVIPRYLTMKGYRVERTWGWDCHGLPIENIIEKELKLPNKQAIEEFGIDNFNDSCRSTVMRYAADWKKVIHRLGRFVDMDHDYKTMEPWYMESLWWVFKSLYDRKLIYQGYKSMQICPRCVTPLSNFEVSQGYKDIKDISVIAEFKLKPTSHHSALLSSHQSFDIRFLAWTTTPWTLPGNVLLALNPTATYVLAKGNAENLRYICAKDRLEFVFGDDPYQIELEIPASELNNLEYEPLFPYYQNTPNAFKTVMADFVSLVEGTGIVHIAPAFGEEDYQIGLRENLPMVQHVDMEGKFKPEVVDFAGLSVKPKENHVSTDVLIIKHLTAVEKLFKKINLTHSYPHCWRCDTPLINYATNSWFVKVTQIKTDLLSNNQKINWVPDHIKNGRFGKWLENARDWAISRNRYWGTPLPVWQSADGDTICVGSITELESLSGQKITDLHKEVVDKITFTKDGKEYQRISEVLDCWFESGAMPYASFHYPFENKAKFERLFPAEFISEGQDQTRGWFYTLHVLATALTHGKNPAINVSATTSSFKNCVCSGIVLAEDGKKMSKKLQNYPDPMLIADKYGVDALRLYLMNSPVVKAENLNFSEKGVDEIRKKVINILINVTSFYKTYQSDHSITKPEYPTSNNVLDRWLISLVESTTKLVTEKLDAYDIVAASRAVMDLVDEFSTWWLRNSRERLKLESSNQEAMSVFGWALKRTALLLAPFAPFIAEYVYQQLDGNSQVSIHLDDWVVVNQSKIDHELELEMTEIRRVVEKTHAARKEAGIKTRQPLAKLHVTSKLASPEASLLEVIAAEVNVKEIGWSQNDDFSVKLDVTLTEELVAEGQARDIIRQIQDERKRLGTDINDLVTVNLPGWPEKYASEIMSKTKAKVLVLSNDFSVYIDSDQAH